jgi:hypothetical protein
MPFIRSTLITSVIVGVIFSLDLLVFRPSIDNESDLAQYLFREQQRGKAVHDLRQYKTDPGDDIPVNWSLRRAQFTK